MPETISVQVTLSPEVKAHLAKTLEEITARMDLLEAVAGAALAALGPATRATDKLDTKTRLDPRAMESQKDTVLGSRKALERLGDCLRALEVAR